MTASSEDIHTPTELLYNMCALLCGMCTFSYTYSEFVCLSPSSCPRVQWKHTLLLTTILAKNAVIRDMHMYIVL